MFSVPVEPGNRWLPPNNLEAGSRAPRWLSQTCWTGTATQTAGHKLWRSKSNGATPGSCSQSVPLLSTQSAAANNARATDRACAVVRYSSWSADSHTPTSPFSFCTAATSAEKPSSPRKGGQCGPKCLVGSVSPSGCWVWHQLGQVVEVMASVCATQRPKENRGKISPVRRGPKSLKSA